MKKPAETTKLQPIAPRLLDVQGSAFYLSVGVQTVRDWVDDVLLEPVRVPGAALREKGGRIVSRPGKRRMAKLLFDRDDLDDLSMNSNATEPGHEFARALARDGPASHQDAGAPEVVNDQARESDRGVCTQIRRALRPRERDGLFRNIN